MVSNDFDGFDLVLFVKADALDCLLFVSFDVVSRKNEDKVSSFDRTSFVDKLKSILISDRVLF